MKSYTYWIKRAFELENNNFIASEETTKKIKASYLRIANNIRDEVEKIKSKLNNINLIELDDIQAYKYREKLLNELKDKIYKEYRDLAQTEIDISTKHYKDVISDTYKNTTDYLRSIKTNASFSMLKTEAIQDLLSTKWLGENYSKRVWKNTNLLANRMTEILLDGIVLGKSIATMSDQINKIMRVGSFNCERLIRTETNFFHNRTSLKAYSDYGIKKYEYLATIDGRTSQICTKLNGQIFDVDKAKVGVNYPPMHPFCRSTTIAYFEEELQQDDKNIIIEQKAKEDIELYSIGKIDRQIYKVISNNITTDEVIITKERINHIKERHPNDYERFYSYLSEIILNPDYIIAGNKPNTALILKTIEINGEIFKTILRLKTSQDDNNFKNSIITFMKIDYKEWSRLIRNKEILYKRE